MRNNEPSLKSQARLQPIDPVKLPKLFNFSYRIALSSKISLKIFEEYFQQFGRDVGVFIQGKVSNPPNSHISSINLQKAKSVRFVVTCSERSTCIQLMLYEHQIGSLPFFMVPLFLRGLPRFQTSENPIKKLIKEVTSLKLKTIKLKDVNKTIKSKDITKMLKKIDGIRGYRSINHFLGSSVNTIYAILDSEISAKQIIDQKFIMKDNEYGFKVYSLGVPPYLSIKTPLRFSDSPLYKTIPGWEFDRSPKLQASRLLRSSHSFLEVYLRSKHEDNLKFSKLRQIWSLKN